MTVDGNVLTFESKMEVLPDTDKVLKLFGPLDKTTMKAITGSVIFVVSLSQIHSNHPKV